MGKGSKPRPVNYRVYTSNFESIFGQREPQEFQQQQHPRKDDYQCNAMVVICPYRWQGMWVFDDDSVGLHREPFVGGIPEMIDRLVKDVPGADQGFCLTFSTNPFPGSQLHLHWVEGDKKNSEGFGNTYFCREYETTGWLCPALFHYFREAPPHLYVRADARNQSVVDGEP